MSTISVTNVKHESSTSNNIVLDSSANATLGANATVTGNLTVSGTGNQSIAGTLQFNSGYGSVATAYGVRAWINFNGGAPSIGTGRASGNMDAVTDNGTGDYTVNFTTDMPDANYAAFGASGLNGATATSGRSFQPQTTSPAVGSFRFLIRNSETGAALNDALVYVCIVR